MTSLAFRLDLATKASPEPRRQRSRSRSLSLCSSIFGTPMPLTPGGLTQAFALPSETVVSPSAPPAYVYAASPSTPTRAAVQCKLTSYHLPFAMATASVDITPSLAMPAPADKRLPLAATEAAPRDAATLRDTLRALVPGRRVSKARTKKPITSAKIGNAPSRAPAASSFTTIFRKALKSVRRTSQSLSGMPASIAAHELFDTLGDDPFGRGAGADVLAGHRATSSAHADAPAWKTHARKTLSRGGKGSISSPVVQSWSIQPVTSSGNAARITTLPAKAGAVRRPTRGSRSEIPSGWTMSVAVSKQTSPAWPLSRPILFGDDGDGSQADSRGAANQQVSLERLAALARLEGTA